MSVSKKLDFDLEDLPMEVFDLDDTGLTVEALTDGHGMAEAGASCTSCVCICSCCTCS